MATNLACRRAIRASLSIANSPCSPLMTKTAPVLCTLYQRDAFFEASLKRLVRLGVDAAVSSPA
jgi:hypothetical protein